MTATLDRRPSCRHRDSPRRSDVARPRPSADAVVEAEPPAPKELLIIDYSGDLEKTWATTDPGHHRRRQGVKTKVFFTFWGLQRSSRTEVRITGKNWMQKMLSLMQRPGHQPPQALAR